MKIEIDVTDGEAHAFAAWLKKRAPGAPTPQASVAAALLSAIGPLPVPKKSGPPKQVLEVTFIQYQRNGISGEGFFHVGFRPTDEPNRALQAVVLSKDADERLGAVGSFVFDPADPSFHWRGDYFAGELRAAVEDWKKKEWG